MHHLSTSKSHRHTMDGQYSRISSHSFYGGFLDGDKMCPKMANVSGFQSYRYIAIYVLQKCKSNYHSQGVCESVVFGVPLILRPTLCWKLEWEELEGNQQRFHAFCKLLTEKVCVFVLLEYLLIVSYRLTQLFG